MTSRPHPDAQCLLRPGEACRLCQPGATGPDDCPTAYLVMTDDELRAGLERVWRDRCAALGPFDGDDRGLRAFAAWSLSADTSRTSRYPMPVSTSSSRTAS